MAEDIVVLHGGPRDGESTTVAAGTQRLLAKSDAPGLLEVYESSGQTEVLRGNDELAVVFEHVGQAPAEGVNPELLTGGSS
jgi:hypothetical protein